eukprot:6752813-Ditylum_brightwellii.AAC.1
MVLKIKTRTFSSLPLSSSTKRRKQRKKQIDYVGSTKRTKEAVYLCPWKYSVIFSQLCNYKRNFVGAPHFLPPITNRLTKTKYTQPKIPHGQIFVQNNAVDSSPSTSELSGLKQDLKQQYSMDTKSDHVGAPLTEADSSNQLSPEVSSTALPTTDASFKEELKAESVP